MTKAAGDGETTSTRKQAKESTEAKPARRVPRKVVLISAGAVLLVLVDALLLVLVSRWQNEAEAQIAANETTGTALSALRADLAEQEGLKNLISEQSDATEERISELEGLEASSIAEVYEIRDAVIGLTECHDAQIDLIAFQWTSNINTGGLDREAAVRQQCAEAKTTFNKVKVEVDE